VSSTTTHDLGGGFRHEALLYADDAEFIAGTTPFIRAGLVHGEAVLVTLCPDKIDLLSDALGANADAVCFTDMEQVGRNPGRIISTWASFLDEHTQAGCKVRAIGEPVWQGRSAAELTECQRHEMLLNLAFADSPAWSLLCPYDTANLAPETIAEARRSHPYLVEGGEARASDPYRETEGEPAPFAGKLPAPGGPPEEYAVSLADLHEIRSVVAAHALAAGIDTTRAADLVLAVTEIATNTLRHADGEGKVRVWRENGSLLCEVVDRGRISDPLTGRLPPAPERLDGRGLWIANQLCDLVQIRSSEAENVVRVHMSVAA